LTRLTLRYYARSSVPKKPNGKLPTGRPPSGLYPHISRKELGSLLRTSPNNVCRILLGYRKCSSSQLIVLSHRLGVSPERLDRELRTAQDRMLRKMDQRERLTRASSGETSSRELKRSA
jgi:hypothetical protein